MVFARSILGLVLHPPADFFCTQVFNEVGEVDWSKLTSHAARFYVLPTLIQRAPRLGIYLDGH